MRKIEDVFDVPAVRKRLTMPRVPKSTPTGGQGSYVMELSHYDVVPPVSCVPPLVMLSAAKDLATKEQVGSPDATSSSGRRLVGRF